MATLEMKAFRFTPSQLELAHLRKNWGWFLAEGILLALFGVIAWSFAVFTTLASIVFLGWLLLIGGIVHTVHSFFTGSWSGFFLELLTGILYGIAGLLMISSPGITAITLTLILAPLFMVGGLFRLTGALINRFPQWGWACFSGVITFLVGLMIWNQMPVSGLWVIGALIGIELFFRGLAVAMFAMKLRSLPIEREMRAAA